jgi:hypothetical protein
MFYPPIYIPPYVAEQKEEDEEDIMEVENFPQDDSAEITPDYCTLAIKGAFDKARDAELANNIEFFVPAVKHMIEVLDGQDGLTPAVTHYFLKVWRKAPLKANLSAYRDVSKYDRLGYAGIYDTKCLQLFIRLQHEAIEASMNKMLISEYDHPSVHLWLIDNGYGEVRWAEDIEKHNDPNDAIDPFSEEAKKKLIQQVADKLAASLPEMMRVAKEKEGLGIAANQKNLKSPSKCVVRLK